MAKKTCFVIGIGGGTNSGKSSLSSMLSKALPNCKWMCQDHYFLAADDPRLEQEANGMINWDKLSALDMETMMEDVTTWVEQHQDSTKPAYLIIDGFLIFNYKPMTKLFDRKFFIEVDRETCRKRRLTRIYDPPDCPGYFEDIAWPMYQKNLRELEDQHDIDYLDGADPLDEIFDKVLLVIQTKMGSVL